MTTLGSLIESHGYWVLALGCLLEGETVLLLAGFAAHRGYLHLPLVLAIACTAAFLGDQAFFWLGRRHGSAVLARLPSVGARLARVHSLLERHGAWWVVGMRFAYGLRIAGPVLVGVSQMPPARFALFNALGAVLWAILVGGAGWAFGVAAERLLGEVRQIEGWLLLALAAAATLWWWLRRRRDP